MDRPVPLVSVVVPAYNAAGFIAKTLDTVAAQTFRDFELVVIDDGSKDATAETVDAWLKDTKTPGRCIRQENKKIAGARNAGWRAARGAWVAFLDHDDAWTPDKLAVCLRELAASRADLVCHDENLVEDGRVVKVHRNGPVAEPVYDGLLLEGNALSPSCVVLRKAKLEEVGGFREDADLDTVEDYDLWLRLARVAKLLFLPLVLGEYRFSPSGASRRILYHQSHLESLLERHFKERFGDAPKGLDALRVRRRRASACRSGLGLLMAYGSDPAGERELALRMLRTWPFDAKNAFRAAQWALRSLRAPGKTSS